MADASPEITPALVFGVITAVAAFLAISILLGLLTRRKTRTFEEWLIGHRDIGPVVTGFALIATYLSGWAMYGNAGLGYTFGWAGSWLIGTVCIMGIALCLVMGYRVRRYVQLGARTVPEMLRVRFESKTLQALAGLSMVVLLIVYSVGQYKAMATVWTITTATPFQWSLVITAAMVLVYVAAGGYIGTQWVSCFQGILLTVAGWTLGVTSLLWAGGPAKIEEMLKTQSFTTPGGDSTGIPLSSYIIPPSTPKDMAYPWVDWVGVTASIFMFLFMATGFPHNVARFLGTRKISKKEYWTMLFIAIIGGLTPLWIGVVGFAGRAVFGGVLLTSQYKPIYGDAVGALVSISAGGVPLAALFTASVFAASVSTLAGMALIMATNITRDLLHNANPNLSPKGLLWLTRIMLIPFIAIPLWWTMTATPPVLSVFMAGSAVAQAGIFFFVVGVSMYWRRATKWGAASSIVYGMFLTVLHPQAYGRHVGLYHWGCWALLLIFGSASAYFLVSLLTKPLPKEKLEKLF
ncbi:MAG: sodium:solute symporter family protein [Candidatus Bathyarchaeota archaeon]|nr:sodium:solute symporter family protein [Candidatus Bathyarchaeota archaeon]